MNLNELTDQLLWANIQLDDRRAFTELYNRHWSKLYRTALYYLKDAELAEQIVHDVFLAIWNKRSYLVIENFDNYLYFTAKNHVYSHLRLKSAPIDYKESIPDTGLSCLNTAEDAIRSRELDKQLKSQLDKLPRRCREIFQLSRIDNLSNDEIAAHFDISKRTVENQITYATKQLRLFYKEASFVTSLVIILYNL